MSEFQPLPGRQLLSAAKLSWWNTPWKNGPIPAVPRWMLLLSVMAKTPCAASPQASVLLKYLQRDKFHDEEPQAIVEQILERDPNFFWDFPMRNNLYADTFGEAASDKPKPDWFKDSNEAVRKILKWMRATVGEAAIHFAKAGQAGYGKPALRAEQPVEIGI